MLLRNELRQATSELHNRAEEVLQLAQMGKSREFYKRTLCRFYGYYADIEPKLVSCFQKYPINLDYSNRQKLPWIHDDLIQLGMRPQEILQLPVHSSRIEIRTLAGAIGCAYVLEGSTLGGTLISKHIFRTLGLGPDSGCRFFTGYGDDTAMRWREFVAAMEVLSDAPNVQSETVLSAKRTFESLMEWFELELPKNHRS